MSVLCFHSPGALTEAPAVEAYRLPEKTVEPAHAVQRRARPAVGRDARLDLLPEGRNDVRFLREDVEGMRSDLPVGTRVLRFSIAFF